jgi:hypothetical protein
MSANTKNSVQLLTALSNKGELPPSIQNLHLFKDNGIDVTEQALTRAVQSLKIARPPPPPPEETPGATTSRGEGTTRPRGDGLSTVGPLSLTRIGPGADAADAAAADDDDADDA